ncbi:MAG: hypothetical protein R3F13_10600 [Prosthecobacter sp.]
MPPSDQLLNHLHVRHVRSFDELVTTRFGDGVNALCWPRALQGNFEEVATKLEVGQGITHLIEEQLRALPLSPSGWMAVETMLEDHRLLTAHRLDPVLDCINGYLPVDDPGPLRTDVCSFHVDSATCEADTYLCTYFGASSEGLANEEAVRHIDLSGTRTRLLQHYGGVDDAGFREWLNDHYFDLHYAPLPEAKPYEFGVGNLWRVATLHAGSPVPPCIHRAPDPVPGQRRLLLIS